MADSTNLIKAEGISKKDKDPKINHTQRSKWAKRVTTSVRSGKNNLTILARAEQRNLSTAENIEKESPCKKTRKSAYGKNREENFSVNRINSIVSMTIVEPQEVVRVTISFNTKILHKFCFNLISLVNLSGLGITNSSNSTTIDRNVFKLLIIFLWLRKRTTSTCKKVLTLRAIVELRGGATHTNSWNLERDSLSLVDTGNSPCSSKLTTLKQKTREAKYYWVNYFVKIQAGKDFFDEPEPAELNEIKNYCKYDCIFGSLHFMGISRTEASNALGTLVDCKYYCMDVCTKRSKIVYTRSQELKQLVKVIGAELKISRVRQSQTVRAWGITQLDIVKDTSCQCSLSLRIYEFRDNG